MNFNIQALEEKLSKISNDSKEMDENQHYNIMNERYKKSGRDAKNHPMHGFYTGLKAEYEQVSNNNSK